MKCMTSVTAFAPATIANIGFGYDILGMAIEAPGDDVTIILRDDNQIIIEGVAGDGGVLPLNPDGNTAGVAVITYLKSIGSDQGVSILLKKGMPMGSGMGSSAASAAAALIAINYLMGEPLTRKELVPFGMAAEAVACGSFHGDNVAPSILGGIVLIQGERVTRLPEWDQLYYMVIHPEIVIRTEDSRALLPDQIPLTDAVNQWSGIAGLITAICTQNQQLLRDTFQQPEWISSYRCKLIPGFEQLKQFALDQGAIGFNISGSGPSLFALVPSPEIGEKIGSGLKLMLQQRGIKSQHYCGSVNHRGAEVIGYE